MVGKDIRLNGYYVVECRKSTSYKCTCRVQAESPTRARLLSCVDEVRIVGRQRGPLTKVTYGLHHPSFHHSR
eukprot:scaffold12005_cov212-Amphora_coffeaeformis.AAC.3